MKKSIIFFLLISFAVNSLMAQVKYEVFKSFKLQESRQLKIQLPRSYNSNKEKTYPLIVVLDGDYLFEAVAGNVDYFSYWEDMPEAIVVGINQVGKRYDDVLYSTDNSLPIDTGARFFEFIGAELVPHFVKNYRVGDFKAIMGHGGTANFINYYLMKSAPLFNAYIAISPDLAPEMLDYMSQALSKIESKVFYYLSNTTEAPRSITDMANALNTELSIIENENLLYTFKSFEGASYYSAPAHAVPNALEVIFKKYQPITRNQYKNVLLNLESPVSFLLEKYQAIKDIYGIDKKIIINDFKAIAAAIEETKTFEGYEELGKLAQKHYPKTLLGGYYTGRFLEETGETWKAMRTYKAAYIYEEIAGVKRDELMERANSIKEDFGYD